MLPTTKDAVKAMLKADPSLTPQDRNRIMTLMTNHGHEPEKEDRQPLRKDTRILPRAEVARRFNRSLRFVDKLAAEGVLQRVTLPGRVRACGYREADVERLMCGVAVER